MKRIFYFCLFMVLLCISQTAVVADNASDLRPYLDEYIPTKLEWELLKVNMSWLGSFEGSVDYVNSFKVIFNWRDMQFYTSLRVQNKRSWDDSEPFDRLPNSKKRSILLGPVSYLTSLLSLSFPEIEDNKNLLLIDFVMRFRNGTSVLVATYSNGFLELKD